MSDLRRKWDERYRAQDTVPHACEVLRQYRHLLPGSGIALDMACGLGGNALLLAGAGLDTRAWDLSPVAVERLRQHTAGEGLALDAQVRDVTIDPPAPDSLDVLVVSYFLDRALVPALLAALRPGALLYYQTFTVERVSDRGPSNDAYRLRPNELLHLFKDLRILAYRDEGTVGDTAAGSRDEAMLVAMNPA